MIAISASALEELIIRDESSLLHREREREKRESVWENRNVEKAEPGGE